jgi:hypothetical protein
MRFWDALAGVGLQRKRTYRARLISLKFFRQVEDSGNIRGCVWAFGNRRREAAHAAPLAWFSKRGKAYSVSVVYFGTTAKTHITTDVGCFEILYASKIAQRTSLANFVILDAGGRDKTQHIQCFSLGFRKRARTHRSLCFGISTTAKASISTDVGCFETLYARRRRNVHVQLALMFWMQSLIWTQEKRRSTW